MNKIKVSCISMKTTPMDFSGNLNKIKKILEDKENSASQLILFPELCISGYGCEDAFYNPYIWENAKKSLEQIKPYSTNKIIVVGLPIYHSSCLYNSAAVLSNQKLLGIVPKINLANTGVHYEKRWFQENFQAHEYINFNHEQVPFGNIIFKSSDFSFGIEICEDSWVTHRPSSNLSVMGAEIILSMGASHFSFHKQSIRRRIFQESSRAQNNVFLYSNLNGNESGKIIFEGGSLIAQNGSILNEGRRLHFTDYEITKGVLDLDSIKQNKSKNFRNNQNLDHSKILIVPHTLRVSHPNEPLSLPIQLINSNIYSDFSNAVSLGMFDYLIKTKANGFSLSLSGGADSSACAILVTIMKERAKKELGSSIFESFSLDEENLLYTIYQATINNSLETKKYAKMLSEELKVKHYEVNIDSLVNTIIHDLSEEMKITPNWIEHDLALQNIQARARSPIVWLMANLKNHLLISTGNRSEASVGYTTMDGDSSGSLCPISGVSKEFILEWLESINNGLEPLLPKLHSLKLLLNKKPTAELKPLNEFQEDEKDLMPYPLLQKIEKEYVFNGRGEEEILKFLLETEKDLDEDSLKRFISKFIILFKRSQWKRERLPPGFHLDDYGLDPKSSFRFPILS
jgi:NAD+ synthase (glutamine-hydrolysing)